MDEKSGYKQMIRNVMIKDIPSAKDDPRIRRIVSELGEELAPSGRFMIRWPSAEPFLRVLVEAPDGNQCEDAMERFYTVLREGGYLKNGDDVTVASNVTVSETRESKSVEMGGEGGNLSSFRQQMWRYNTMYDCFEIEDGVLKSYSGTDIGCVVPMGVTELGDGVFLDHRELQEVVLPSTLERIGEGAFSGCTGLKKVNLPEGLQSIGDYGFFNCSELESVLLPETLTRIGEGAFIECRALREITIPGGIREIPVDMLRGCVGLETVTIESGTERISGFAFQDDTALAKVQLPDTLKEIGEYAFAYCASLKEVCFPEALKSIGAYAFGFCTALQKVVSPGYADLHDDTFSGCNEKMEIIRGGKALHLRDLKGAW